jgi:death-on-curing protein
LPNEEPSWLSVDVLVDFNRELVGLTNEPHGILSPGSLESACFHPRNAWYYDNEEDLVTLGAELILAIARNHAFVQGNKRTGFAAGLAFIKINGFTVNERADDVFGWAVEETLLGRMSEEEFIEGLRELIVAD